MHIRQGNYFFSILFKHLVRRGQLFRLAKFKNIKVSKIVVRNLKWLPNIRDAHDRWRPFSQWSRGLEVVRMHRDLSSFACHTSKHLCTEQTTSKSLMFCHQRLSIANSFYLFLPVGKRFLNVR